MAPSITFPPAAAIEIFNGSNWPSWSARMLALFRMNGLRDHISIGSKPSDADQAVIWVVEEGMLLSVLDVTFYLLPCAFYCLSLVLYPLFYPISTLVAAAFLCATPFARYGSHA